MGDDSHTNTGGISSVLAQTACFDVQTPGGNLLPTTIHVVGTSFQKSGATPSTALLLLHGSASGREVWDGGPAGHLTGDSMARRLAKQGYRVITVDRPGVAESTDPRIGGGYVNDTTSQIEMIHQLVAQVRLGDYTLTENTDCPSGTPASGISNVVLVGHSIGGTIATGYAGTYFDTDGLVAFGSLTQSLDGQMPSSINNLFLKYVVPQARQEYIYLIDPSHPDAEQDCINFGFYQPALYAIDTAPCAPANLLPNPSAEVESTATQVKINRELVKSYPAGFPVLLAVGEHDNALPGPNNTTGDPDLRTAEFDYWQANCPCDVTTYVQPNSGHEGMLHKSMPLLVDQIHQWLMDSGL